MAAKSANLYDRIEPDVKDQAEQILAALGIPASNAINMFYKQTDELKKLIAEHRSKAAGRKADRGRPSLG